MGAFTRRANREPKKPYSPYVSAPRLSPLADSDGGNLALVSFLYLSSMATPIRKKRNFKALQLDVTQPPPPVDTEPIPTRQAPAPLGGPATTGGKRRPAPITLAAPKLPPSTTSNDGSLKPTTDEILTVESGPSSAPATATPSARRMTYHTTISNTIANFDGGETKFDLRDEDLKDLQELGAGNGGSVKKVEHVPTGTMMAKKVGRLIRVLDLKLNCYLDCAYRRQARSPQTNSAGTTDASRLSLRIHHFLLRRILV